MHVGEKWHCDGAMVMRDSMRDWYGLQEGDYRMQLEIGMQQ